MSLVECATACLPAAALDDGAFRALQKSLNILLDASFRAKLADLGMARIYQGSRVPLSTTVGTWAWSALSPRPSWQQPEMQDFSWPVGPCLVPCTRAHGDSSKLVGTAGLQVLHLRGCRGGCLACRTAPEVRLYQREATVKADIFSLGVVLWELHSANRPGGGPMMPRSAPQPVFSRT